MSSKKKRLTIKSVEHCRSSYRRRVSYYNLASYVKMGSANGGKDRRSTGGTLDLEDLVMQASTEAQEKAGPLKEQTARVEGSE